MLQGFRTLLLLATTCVCRGQNPIYDAADYMKLVGQAENGVKYTVLAPDAVPLDVVHVYGTSRERGVAHGRLMSARTLDFLNVQLPKFYAQQVADIDLSKLPDWLAAAIEQLLLPSAESHAEEIFNLALQWLDEVQQPFNTAGRAPLSEELQGMAEGVCDTAAHAGVECDAASVYTQLRLVNELPDLIRMQCSMIGAWGNATADGSLVQLRSLDFGGGPFANNSFLLVQHPAGATPFAALSFPGFVGIVTGLSPRIAQSEKVNDLHGGGTPPGTYHGQNTAYVIRDIVQFAASKEEAHAMAVAANRTWGVWLGFGDAASQEMLVVEYMQASAEAYDDRTLPALTGQPPFPQVAYIDKHAQPSVDDKTLPEALTPLLGQLSASVMAQEIPRATQSGDVHIAVYDFTLGRSAVLFALGSTDENGTYTGPGGRYAYAAPYVRFPLEGEGGLWQVTARG